MILYIKKISLFITNKYLVSKAKFFVEINKPVNVRNRYIPTKGTVVKSKTKAINFKDIF